VGIKSASRRCGFVAAPIYDNAVLRTSGFRMGSFSKVLDIIARTRMSIKPGTRIGPYEVASPLGEGGMGVVFRAHDTKLQRDVALKLLPDQFADDPDRLVRFQCEAQILASLNHPNIAQIYGLEERCIVMELVEGKTLQERLKRGPIPVDEALQIASKW